MQLSLHTDLALRVLMDLGVGGRDRLETTAAIAGRFSVSEHHLQKVVQRLRRLGLVETVRGVGGGLKLAVDPVTVRLGQTILALESRGKIVDCKRGPCPLAGSCRLKGVLDGAEGAFFAYMDQFTLDQMLQEPTGRVLAFLRRA